MLGVNQLKWIIKSTIRRSLPTSFVEYVRKKRRVKRLERIRANISGFDLSVFHEILTNLAINKQGNLFVHSGSDYFTKVTGGPFAVLKILLSYMEAGTLLMPAFPFDGMAGEYLKANKFSIKKSPSKMGLLTELFRRTAGVIRSLHPTHSVCALGNNAEFMIKTHCDSTFPFDDKSPFAKLVISRGQVLMIGVGLEVLTIVHVIEDELQGDFPFNVYKKQPQIVTVTDFNDNEQPMTTYVHNPDISIRKNIVQFENDLIKENILKVITIGGVEFRLLDAYQFNEFLKIKAKNGKTIYN